MATVINVKGYFLKHLKFITLMLLMCLLFFLRVALSLNIPVIIFIVISTCIALFCSREENVTLMCSLIPLSAFFQYRWALGIVALIYVFKIRKIRAFYFLPLLCMIVWEFLHAGRSGVSTYSLFQEFTELFALTVILSDRNIDYSDGFPLRFFSYMTILGSILCFISLVKFYGFSLSSLTRFGMLNEALNQQTLFQGLFNANVISYICMIAISGLLLLRFYKKDIKSDSFILCFLVFIIILTQSKSALICVLLMHFSYIVLSSHKCTVGSIGKGFASLAFLITCFFVFLDKFVNALISRFMAGDITSGRIGVTMFYHHHLIDTMSNWLYGIGLYCYNIQIKEIYGDLGLYFPGSVTFLQEKLVYLPAHNNIQEILVAWGIVGLFLCVFLFYMMFRHAHKVHKVIPKVNRVAFFLILIYTFQGQLLSNSVVLLSLLYSLVCLEYEPLLN